MDPLNIKNIKFQILIDLLSFKREIKKQKTKKKQRASDPFTFKGINKKLETKIVLI